MIIDILNFIEDNIESSKMLKKKGRLSALHLDMHQSNMQRALAFVFEENSKHPKYVVKYPKCQEYKKHLLGEFDRYSEIYERLSSGLKSHLNSPICIYDNGNNVATIEEGVAGVSLLSLAKKGGQGEQLLAHIDKSFDFLIKFQSETSSGNTPPLDFFLKNIELPIELFCKKFSLSFSEKNTVSFVKEKVIKFLTSSNSVSACHGDYWLNNILIYKGHIFVIDWANCIGRFFRFWDFYSLIYMTSVTGVGVSLKFNEMCDYYLKKIEITDEIDKELRIIYCAIRSVWNKFLFNEDSLWDTQWNDKFDFELSKYRAR